LTHKTNAQYGAGELKQRTLALINKHLDQILNQDKPMTSTEGNVLQNYLKALIMAEKAELDQLAMNDPRRMSDAELKAAAAEAMAALGDDNATPDQTSQADGLGVRDFELPEDDEGEDAF
jgi:hypothetical protein